MGTEGHYLPAIVERESAPVVAPQSPELVRLNKIARELGMKERLDANAVPEEIEAFREKVKAVI